MSGRDGMETLRDIKRAKPKLPVLALGIAPDERPAVAALRTGASGYLTMEGADEVLSAVKRVFRGGRHISPSIAEKLAMELETGEKKLHEYLSHREQQVMCMIVSGKKSREIAAELSLSIKTVNTYRARILNKMRMKTNSELITYAAENRLCVFNT